MTGADIVGELLRGCAPLVAIVPIERIKLGTLPERTDLPALLIRTVSVIEWQTLRTGSMVRMIERTSATVRAANRRDQVEIIRLAKNHLRGWRGDLGVARRVSILLAGTGPDVDGPGNSFVQGTDFRVSFDAPT